MYFHIVKILLVRSDKIYTAVELDIWGIRHNHLIVQENGVYSQNLLQHQTWWIPTSWLFQRHNCELGPGTGKLGGWVRSDKNIYSCSIRYYVHTFYFWDLHIENFMYSIHKYWYCINLDQYQNCVLRVRPNHSYIYLISRNETITWDSVLKCGWIIRWVNEQNYLFYWYLI